MSDERTKALEEAMQRLERTAIALRLENDPVQEMVRIGALADARVAVRELFAAPHPDTARLDALEKIAGERQCWFHSDVMPKGTLGHVRWGHHRWTVGGQGLTTNGDGASTLREAIDHAVARGISPDGEASRG